MDEMILNRKQTPIEIALDIDDTGHTTAKKLYSWLELDPTHYAKWIKANITENLFASEGTDFTPLSAKSTGGRPSIDYLLSASFAKKLAMTSRSPKGEETREYFVKVEDALVKTTERHLSPAEMFLQNAQILVEQERRLAALETGQDIMAAGLDHLEEKQNALEARQSVMENKIDPFIGMEYFTITGYINQMKYRVSPNDYGKLGKEATKLSKAKGYPIGSAPNPTYGHVGTYHLDILKEVFDSYHGKW